MNTKKIIKKISPWLLKLTAFILYLKYAIIGVVLFFLIPFAFAFVCAAGTMNYSTPLWQIFISVFVVFFLFYFCIILIYYFTAKLFGIFKFIDKKFKNIFIKIIALILVSWVIYYFAQDAFYRDTSNLCSLGFPFDIFIASSLPVAYFLYKYFNYLTIKHPRIFKKINRLTSLYFYKKFIPHSISYLIRLLKDLFHAK